MVGFLCGGVWVVIQMTERIIDALQVVRMVEV
jgi:hypothetical protein